jgi:hypothetical protein
MLLQIVTIFKANESHLKFDLPSNLNVFDYAKKPLNDNKITSFQVLLKSLTICANNAHSHVKPIIEYPYNEDDEEVVRETYKIQIRKQPLGSRRRSTLYYLPHLDLEYVDEEQQQRQRRGLDEEYFTIEAGFKDPFYKASIQTPYAKNNLVTVGEINESFILKCNQHFAQLLRNPLVLSKTVLRNTIKLTFRIPPNSFFGFSDQRFWREMGFEEGMNQTFTLFTFKGKKYTGFKNDTLVYRVIVNQTYPQADISLNEYIDDIIEGGITELDILFTLISGYATEKTVITPEQVSCVQDVTVFTNILNHSLANLFGSLVLLTNHLPHFNERRINNSLILKGLIPTSPDADINRFNFYIRFGGTPNILTQVGVDNNNKLWFPYQKPWESNLLTNVQKASQEVCSKIDISRDASTSILHNLQNTFSFLEELPADLTSTPLPKKDSISEFKTTLEGHLASATSNFVKINTLKRAKEELPLLYASHVDYQSRKRIDALSDEVNRDLENLSRETDIIEIVPTGDEIHESILEIIKQRKMAQEEGVSRVIDFETSSKRKIEDITITVPADNEDKKRNRTEEEEIVSVTGKRKKDDMTLTEELFPSPKKNRTEEEEEED